MGRVASYDVFDTVLTRLLGGPRQVFVETGRRLLHRGTVAIPAETYAAAREHAGSDLTLDIAIHPPLARISQEVAARLGLAPDSAAMLHDVELDVERAACRAVPGSEARLARSRRDTGRGIVFISDTSLPQEFLKDLLIREGLYQDGDQLFTSAMSGATKQQGALFDVVAAELGIEPGQFDHVGDDRWSDVAHPRLHGWNARLDSACHFTARETRLDAKALATDGLGPRLAAASRMSRLHAAAEGTDPSLAEIAGGVALPLLAGFATWVLGQAQLLELDRLYFVARDGEVFLEVTRRLAEQTAAPVECRYLYGSRKAWQLAGVSILAPLEQGDYWLPDDQRGEELTLEAVLALGDLTREQAYSLTGDALFAPGPAGVPLGSAAWADVRSLLTASPLREQVAERARHRGELLVRYLAQEQVTAPGRVGLVDVGWTGRAARALEDVLLEHGQALPAAHLFLGLQSTAEAVMGADLHSRAHGWLLDETRGRPTRTTQEDPVMLIETFAMGTEGHTLGYREQDGRVVAELTAGQNPLADRWGLAAYRRSLQHGLDAFLQGTPANPAVDLRPLVWQELLNFWRQPTREEARAWGAQPYGEDFHNALSHPLATPATLPRMLTRLGLGRQEWREPTYWLAGTVAISGQPGRTILRTVGSGQQLARRIPRIPRRLRAEWVLRRPDPG